MSRRRLVLVVAALLTVAALGFVAASLDDAGTGGSQTAGESRSASGASAGTEPGSRGVGLALVAALVALAVGGLAYALARDSMPRWLVVVLVVSVAVLLLLVAVGYVLDPAPEANATGTPTPEPVGESDRSTPVGAEPGGTAGGPLSVTETVVLLALVVLGGALVVARLTEGESVEESGASSPDGDAAAVGEAAGRAAEELDETTLSNAVYRAFHEMTEALDVDDPETTTPAEFADAAVGAGLDEDDVTALTDLFREVRYGDAPATEAREERAREVLRRIESTYADGTGVSTGAPEEGDSESGGGGDR